MERIIIVNSDDIVKREFYETVKATKFKKIRCKSLEDLRRSKGARKTVLNDIEYYKYKPHGYDKEYIFTLDHVNQRAIRVNI